MTSRRVVVSGMGVTSPIGNDFDSVVQALQSGTSGIKHMPDWEQVDELRCHVAGLVEGIAFSDYPRRKVRTMGRVALLSAYASERAVQDAGLSESDLESGKIGIAYGSTHGSSSCFEQYCRQLFSTDSFCGIMGSHFLKFMSHTCAANLAEFLGVRGRVQPTCSACTSGSQAIGLAFEYICSGLQDVMICGGAEEVHYTHAGVFDVMYAASTKFSDAPTSTPRPFDLDRDGVVIGEGAGTLILEDYDRAKARGAKVYAELVGYGTNCDGLHLTNPSSEGMAECMRLGLASAGIGPEQVDYVNAHGTATELGDIAESKATFEVFGERVPVSTQKSYTGHTLGACGAIESIYSILMMQHGFLAHNRNLEQVDSKCAPLNYIHQQAIEKKVDWIINNNFAFGGINTSLILRRI